MMNNKHAPVHKSHAFIRAQPLECCGGEGDFGWKNINVPISK